MQQDRFKSANGGSILLMMQRWAELNEEERGRREKISQPPRAHSHYLSCPILPFLLFPSLQALIIFLTLCRAVEHFIALGSGGMLWHGFKLAWFKDQLLKPPPSKTILSARPLDLIPTLAGGHQYHNSIRVSPARRVQSESRSEQKAGFVAIHPSQKGRRPIETKSNPRPSAVMVVRKSCAWPTDILDWTRR